MSTARAGRVETRVSFSGQGFCEKPQAQAAAARMLTSASAPVLGSRMNMVAPFAGAALYSACSSAADPHAATSSRCNHKRRRVPAGSRTDRQ